VQGYEKVKGSKAEEIEALVYPSDELYKRLNVMRGTSEAVDPIHTAIEEIIEKVNRGLQPYQRISKIVILDAPLEMTTTKKVKRNYND
ncbi:MAG: long-chain fatty acid--CoA ligase, partial [Spirochaetaceae bacterium]|nr:long-chain fatty acid--CoA ligase [Spirochaetaceae bacterium]